MKLNLSNALPLTIIISFELNDVSTIQQSKKEVKSMEIIALLLATYYPNIIWILMLAREMRA